MKRQAKTYTSVGSIPRRRPGFAVVIDAGLFDKGEPTVYHHFKESRADARAARIRKKILAVHVESLQTEKGETGGILEG